MGTLENRVALITGAGRGIGQALALRMAREGAQIVVNDLDAEPAAETVALIQKLGGTAIAFPGSVTAPDFGERAVQAALSTFNDLHIIVNNAGYTWDALIHKMSDEQFDAMYEVHVKSAFRILRAAAPHFLAASAREAAEGKEVFRKVVNIASTAGFSGNVGQANYSSMKAALVGLTKTLAKEWGPSKVNVNCVGFGMIETRLTEVTDEKKTIVMEDGRQTRVGIPKKVADIAKMLIPMGRAGKPGEAAGAVYLLCTPDADYITGQVIAVSGGLAI